ncbi:serine hydrolase domain-containing protein [Anaerocolumna sp.]|uniref:serine hydrolase domain-containing protein n=1 Tax=Anaerocolumna sp. TaxID=2041569 RepID=UPI0028AA1EE7|nr:serine hydrolase domain-containing protein [Anaerocolumna sp.]
MKEKVETFLKDSIKNKVFTGVSYAIRKGDMLTVNSIGRLGETDQFVNNDTLFDIASCTKIFVSLACMRLMEEGKLALTDTVELYLPSWKDSQTGKITIFQLLTHTSMLPAHIPLYEMSKDREGAFEVLKHILPRKSSGVEYSCLGFIILGRVLEEITKLPLEEVISSYVTRPLGMSNTMYCPKGEDRNNIMPTEYCQWRKRRLIGEVHDENAYHMGGVSGNAGIFSNITDMCRMADAMLWKEGEDQAGGLVTKNTISIMTRNYTGKCEENRGLGWCIKNIPDMTAGEYFSDSSFGHTGYTGTSIWIDPVKDSYAILLTNRVYYSREVEKIRHVRQVFHNLAMS